MFQVEIKAHYPKHSFWKDKKTKEWIYKVSTVHGTFHAEVILEGCPLKFDLKGCFYRFFKDKILVTLPDIGFYDQETKRGVRVPFLTIKKENGDTINHDLLKEIKDAFQEYAALHGLCYDPNWVFRRKKGVHKGKDTARRTYPTATATPPQFTRPLKSKFSPTAFRDFKRS